MHTLFQASQQLVFAPKFSGSSALHSFTYYQVDVFVSSTSSSMLMQLLGPG
jgi:hypothetical protein